MTCFYVITDSEGEDLISGLTMLLGESSYLFTAQKEKTV